MNEEHFHKYQSEWTNDETHHWHATTCGDCKYSEETLKENGLPIVEVNTVGNVAITSKENWLDATLNLTGNHCHEEAPMIATVGLTF